MRPARLPRRLHPGAWWLWAIGLGAAASRTTNPLLLGLLMSVAATVVAARRSSAPWAGAFRGYLILALVVIGLRVLFRVFLGGGLGEEVLFSIPRVPLPSWAAGVSIGGPVTAESLVAALYDGMRLATIVVCVGAANTLADPRRLLRSLPRALYDVGTSVVVALSLAPQIIESVGRVRRARRLRGGERSGWRSLRSLLVPVLEDAMHRSISLAAAMDSRGYGRLGSASPYRRRATGALILAGLGGICLGIFGLIEGSMPSGVAAGSLGAGLASGLGGLMVGASTVGRTRYRPDRWGREEWLIALSGLGAAVAVWGVGLVAPVQVAPGVQPLTWPALPPLAALGIVMSSLPAWVTS